MFSQLAFQIRFGIWTLIYLNVETIIVNRNSYCQFRVYKAWQVS